MDTLALILREVLIFTGVMAISLVALVVIVLRLPAGHPLKRILTLLSYRVGASLGAGLLAIPIEPIPGLDVLYDVGAPVALLYFWYTFFRDASRRRPGPIIDHDPI